MHLIKDPQQTQLYDPYEHILTARARKKLDEGWQGVFRHVILKLLPVEEVSQKFHPTLGPPTKELYSMAGLVFIQEFMGWTCEQAADAYVFNCGVQYALNLEPAMQEMSSRTIERYKKIVREQKLAAGIFDCVTGSLVQALNLRVDKQRLDSTHVFSNMALFGRVKLMRVAVKRFLTQLLRHDEAAHAALPEELHARYTRAADRLFGDTRKDAEARKRLRQEVAEDMHYLVKRFAEDARHNGRTTYKNLERVFLEQCEVVQDRIEVKEKAGARVMQNPSDPDASYDGKKGSGYQVQLSETCSEENEVQLITVALPQTAADKDTETYDQVQQALAENGLLPQQLLADAGYGSDTNVQGAKAAGVELVSPVNRSNHDPGKLHANDFEIDTATETVTACPAGHAPLSSTYEAETGKMRTYFDAAHCAQCPLRSQCPVRGEKTRSFVYTPAQRRGAQRLHNETQPEFRQTYAKRAGVEGTIGRIKRCMGLGKLRVRGKPAVDAAILFKVGGWNILQAAKATAMRAHIKKKVKLAREHLCNTAITLFCQPEVRLHA